MSTADAILAASSEAILICDSGGAIRHWNAAAQDLFGHAPDAVAGQPVAVLFAPDAARRLGQALASAGATRKLDCFAARGTSRDGRLLELVVRLAPVVEPSDEVTGFCLALRAAANHGQTELALTRLVDISQLVGRRFCEAMVGALADVLGVRTVLLAELRPAEPGMAHAIAVWSDGTIAPNFSYDLRGTPCGELLGGDACFHADNVTALYPDDALLVEMGARAYVGAPLRASDGRVVGLLAVIHDHPLDPAAHPETILEIFSARAAAELEREATVTHNEYLGRLIEGSLSEVFVFDAQTLQFVLVNRGARENLGYSMDELRTLTPVDIKPDFTRADFDALVEPLRSGAEASVSFRTRHQRKNGSLYQVEVRLQLITGLGAPVFFAAIEDITQRAAAEAALRRTEARLRRLFAQSPAGILETDASGRIVLVNRTWCEMLGYSDEELLGMTIFDVTHPDSLEQTREALAQLRAGTEGLVIEKSYRHKDGRLLHASSTKSALRSENGQFLGVAAVVLDISERVAAEAKIRKSEAMLRKILDGTLAFIGVLQPDGTLIEANVPALSAGGLTREEVIGRKFWDCFWFSHDPQVMDRLREAVARAAAGSIERYDEVVRMQGDTRMTIDFMLSPVRDEDGTVQYLVPSGFDISERKRQEARVVHLMREVNHRSKNLLTVVQSIARQMPKSSAEEFTQEFGKRLQALAACQDLLTESGWHDVPLQTLIRSQLMHFSDLLGPRITLDGPEVTLGATAAQTLGMAIYELTTNAAKYGALSNDSGTIRIRWQIETDADGTRQFVLEWRESGGPEVVQANSKGFGSVVLDHLVAMTLDAECTTDLDPEGLHWRLNCILSKLHDK